MLHFKNPLTTSQLLGSLPCMVLITGGGTLDSTPAYESKPGDDIFKGQNVITEVCFHACYQVYSLYSCCYCCDRVNVRTAVALRTTR